MPTMTATRTIDRTPKLELAETLTHRALTLILDPAVPVEAAVALLDEATDTYAQMTR